MHDRIDAVLDVRAVDHDAKGVDARRDVFDRDPIVLKDRERPADDADLGGHVRLLHMDGEEVPLAGDARDQVLTGTVGGSLAYHGAALLGLVRVLYLDGDPHLAHREDRVLLQHRGAQVGELAHLIEGDAVDGARIVHDAGVRREEARDVSPVLVEVRIDAAGKNGARDVPTAAVEELDRSVDRRAIEARQHEVAQALDGLADTSLRALEVDLAVMVKDDDVAGV